MSTEAGGEEREQWSSKLDFILSIVSFAVGLGNVWRFPYLCYKNGGGAFLIPYFIVLVCAGIPIFIMEVSLGQYMSRGGVGVWNVAPIFKGIGIATTVTVGILNIYYIVVLAWAVYYCFHAFSTVLPWSHCNNTWNTERCKVSFGENKTCLNWTEVLPLTTESISTATDEPIINCTEWGHNETFVDPVVEFWENKILEISKGVDEPNGIVWQLLLSLLIVWVMCYFCVWKGIRWTGKVVYLTATFPYVLLTILLIRGVMLDGSLEGIIFYLKPDFEKLGSSQVWIDAGTQIFFSYSIANSSMVALGSYNKLKNNCYRQCIMVACINCCTSLYAGFAIFSILGFMAKEQDADIETVAESGPGLAFIAYPKAVTQMPISQLWAVCFFLMIFLLGLGSQFVAMESFITVWTDLFPNLTRKGRRESFIAVYCVISFLLGLPMVTRGGMYVFQLFDFYGASGLALLWICFFECIAVAWIYGDNRYYDNMELMIGHRINPWLRICLKALTPFLTGGIFLFMWIQFEPLKYNRVYEYPGWAQGLGMCLAFSSMICIPAGVVGQFLRTRGSLRQRWKTLITPVLMPHRVPDHWPDREELKLVGQKYYNKSQI